jgi:hypothetical protein
LPSSAGVAAPVGVAAGCVVWSLPVVCANAAAGSAHKAAKAVPDASTQRSEVEPIMMYSPVAPPPQRRLIGIVSNKTAISRHSFFQVAESIGVLASRKRENVASGQHWH